MEPVRRSPFPFRQLCLDGTLAEIRLAAPAVDAVEARSGEVFILNRACRDGRLELVKWLVGFFKFTARDARAGCNRALRKACRNGHLAVAQWLTAYFGLRPADARAKNNWALRKACADGHFEVARWLAAHFRLDPTDAAKGGDLALYDAVDAGDFATARWLAALFGIGPAEVPSDISAEMFAGACADGQLEGAQWLARHFAISAEQARMCHNFALRAACGGGHLATVQWLALSFSLGPDDMRGEEDGSGHAFTLACKAASPATARWMADHFGLTAADVLSNDGAALLNAIWKNFETAQWLIQHFGLTAADVRKCCDRMLVDKTAGVEASDVTDADVERVVWIVLTGEYTRADLEARGLGTAWALADARVDAVSKG